MCVYIVKCYGVIYVYLLCIMCYVLYAIYMYAYVYMYNRIYVYRICICTLYYVYVHVYRTSYISYIVYVYDVLERKGADILILSTFATLVMIIICICTRYTIDNPVG